MDIVLKYTQITSLIYIKRPNKLKNGRLTAQVWIWII